MDACEAAALAHDLGHPPFGHIGEEELNELASDIGGFEGNAQSFRIVAHLATPSRRKEAGLNLSRQTLLALMKYPWARDKNDPKRSEKWGYYQEDAKDAEAFEWAWNGVNRASDEHRTLEAEVMDYADDVTYAVHDLDDFYRAGLIPLELLVASRRQRRRFYGQLANRRKGGTLATNLKEIEETGEDGLFQERLRVSRAFDGGIDQRMLLARVASRLITDLVDEFHVYPTPAPEVRVAGDVETKIEILKGLTRVYVIGRPAFGMTQAGQRQLVRDLYDFFEDVVLEKGARKRDRHALGPLHESRLRAAKDDEVARKRVAIDLIAGLSEPAAIKLHRQLFGGLPPPIQSNALV